MLFSHIGYGFNHVTALPSGITACTDTSRILTSAYTSYLALFECFHHGMKQPEMEERSIYPNHSIYLNRNPRHLCDVKFDHLLITEHPGQASEPKQNQETCPFNPH